MFKINLLNNFYFTTKFSQLVKSRLLTHGVRGRKPPIFPLCQRLRLQNAFLQARHLYILVFLLSCSNYTTYKVKPVPPVLISVKTIPSGHLLTIRATNTEIFFIGYKLYVGNSESSVRNPSDLNAGIQCVSLNLLPNLPIEYSIEVSPNEGGLAPVEAGDNPNRVCKMIAQLQSGQFIALRAMTLSFQMGGSAINFSAPSNSLLVP